MRHCKFEKKNINILYIATGWNTYYIIKKYIWIDCHSLMWLVLKTKLDKTENELNLLRFPFTDN